MEDIKKGDYIRTKDGVIAKLERNIRILKTYVFDNIIQTLDNEDLHVISESELRKKYKKHSSNLIDLIEVGDLIQLKGAEELKYEVLKISYSERKGKHIHIINPFRTEGGKDIFIEDIKLIVTHEMFEKVSYEV